MPLDNMFFDEPVDVKSSGIAKFDEAVGGELRPGLVIFTGEPATAKSALALMMAACSTPQSLYVTCEMPVREVFKRLISRHKHVSLNAIAQKRVSGEQYKTLGNETISELHKMSILDGMAGYVSDDLIRGHINALSTTESVFLVIDSAQAWMAAGLASGQLQDQNAVTKTVQSLVDFAAHQNSYVFVISQKNSKYTELERQLEFAADTVVDFYWERNGNPDAQGNRTLRLTFVKNRHGEAKKQIFLNFIGEYQDFK